MSLTEKQILRHIDERSYKKGRRYFQSGAIFDARRQGDTLKARCRGSSQSDYRVEATVKKGKVASASCSCPVGAGGHCKHVAALLLTWKESPDQFREAEDLDALLAKRSKEELLELIQLMLQKEPDLESLLEIVLPGSDGSPAANPEIYQRRIAAAFENAGYGWGADEEVVSELDTVKRIGDGYLAKKDWSSAAAVYRGVLAGVVESYGSFQDESSSSINVVNKCIGQLRKCLKRLQEPAERESVIRSLWEIYRYDIDFGGIGLGEDVPEIFEKDLTDAERTTVAEWIRPLIKKQPGQKDSWADDWHRQQYGAIYLDLKGEALSDEEYLQLCRESGLVGDVVNWLLERKRIEEAQAEAQHVADHELPPIADLFVQFGDQERAARMVQERLRTSPRPHHVLREWLEKFYTSQKNWEAVLTLAKEQLQECPSLPRYKHLRGIAKKLKRWPQMREELLEIIKKNPQGVTLLIEIALDEKDVETALRLVKSRKRSGYGPGSHYPVNLEIWVARAAKKDYPEAALELYLQEAELLIAGRARENYHRAAQHLKHVRELYQRLGREAEWQACIQAIRNENPTLRALRDELNAAKL